MQAHSWVRSTPFASVRAGTLGALLLVVGAGAGCGGSSDPCAGYSCGRGTCQGVGGVATCTCGAGYAGVDCAVCASGFAPDATGACVAAQPCLPSSCGGHGTCSASLGLVSCACDGGYAGPNCAACDATSHRDASGACVPNESCALAGPCGAHGTCDDASGVIVCRCDAGYAGADCDACYPGYHTDDGGACVLDEVCRATTCSGAGTCSDASGVIVCTCQTGYAGARCESCDAIAELAALMRPTLTIVDASRVLMENGPQGGNPADVKPVRTIAAGTDPVALDAWAAGLFGAGPLPGNLTLAAGMGLGRIDYRALAPVELATG